MLKMRNTKTVPAIQNYNINVRCVLSGEGRCLVNDDSYSTPVAFQQFQHFYNQTLSYGTVDQVEGTLLLHPGGHVKVLNTDAHWSSALQYRDGTNIVNLNRDDATRHHVNQ